MLDFSTLTVYFTSNVIHDKTSYDSFLINNLRYIHIKVCLFLGRLN